MPSVNKINSTIASIRDVPASTIEAYTRDIRKHAPDLLPETKRGGGGPPLSTTMVGYVLGAVLRGSTTKAATNAREVGDLIVHSDGGPILEPVLEVQLKMFGWAEDMSFARMVGWLIDRHVDGTIGNFLSEGKSYRIEVDRYWTTARLYCQPALPLIDYYVDAWRACFKDMPHMLPQRNLDGSLVKPMEIGFHTPLLHEAKISYGVDKARNREAHRRFRELKQRDQEFDLWGSESITHKTLIAIAEVFK